jgi:hypothetical protein
VGLSASGDSTNEDGDAEQLAANDEDEGEQEEKPTQCKAQLILKYALFGVSYRSRMIAGGD